MQEDRNETEFPAIISSLSPALGERSSIKDPNLGTIVDNRFQLLENVGSGGSSTVYRARDRNSNRILALKLLHSHFVTDQFIVDRFKREAETSKLLRHPNVVDVESWAVSESGQVYMTEEFVEGISLQDAIAESGWLSVDLTLAVAAQICSGLAAAHEMGVVHCDLKPGNIMLTRSPEGMLIVKVLDFGIAKIMPVTGDTVMRMTQSGSMQGSLLYMSPEQCLDEDLDGRSDVYSLACVIYEALTGKPPLCSRTAFATMNQHLTTMPAPLSTVRADLRWPDKLEATLSRAYAKKPKDRYQSMAEFQTALKKVIDLPIEIEWPERWTARSVRVEADLKVSEIVSSSRFSDEEISPEVPFLPREPEPKKLIETLLRGFADIPSLLDSAVISFMIALALALMAFMAFQPGSGQSPFWFMLFSTVSIGFASNRWNAYLGSRNISILRKVSLNNAPDYIKKLQWQRVSVIDIVKRGANFYSVSFEFTDANGNLLREKVSVHGITSDAVLRQVEEKTTTDGSNSVKALPAASVLPVITLQYPFSGYLFRDNHGDKIAISILSDVGWIYGD